MLAYLVKTDSSSLLAVFLWIFYQIWESSDLVMTGVLILIYHVVLEIFHLCISYYLPVGVLQYTNSKLELPSQFFRPFWRLYKNVLLFSIINVIIYIIVIFPLVHFTALWNSSLSFFLILMFFLALASLVLKIPQFSLLCSEFLQLSE